MEKIKVDPLNFASYRKIISEKFYDEILTLAKNLKGVSIAHVNATPEGGGVAEILRRMIPLFESIGVSSFWYVIPHNFEFFEVTKSIHNFLQGKPGKLSRKDKEIFLSHTKETAQELAKESADIWVIHDPQPVAVIKYLDGIIRPAIWRCHIDMTSYNQDVWDFIRPYVSQYDRFVFSIPQYVPLDMPEEKIYVIPPTIDPFSIKNGPLGEEKAKRILKKFGIDTKRPLITQVSRYDPWKDPCGVIDAYRKAKKEIPGLQLAYLGKIADDDPEGVKIFAQTEEHAGRDPDIHLILNPPDFDRVINAFQSASDIVLQKSTREGFGMTVTEAMWKGTPVVAGEVGGIKAQITDGESGFLVNSVEECAKRIIELLSDSKLAQKIGQAGKDRVSEKFLIPNQIFDWLTVFQTLLQEVQKPQFKRPQLVKEI